MGKYDINVNAINKLRQQADKLNAVANHKLHGKSVHDEDTESIDDDVRNIVGNDDSDKESKAISKLNPSDYRRVVTEIVYKLAIGESPQKICDDCGVTMQAVRAIQKKNKEEQINELRGKTSYEFYADYNVVSSHIQSSLFEMIKGDVTQEDLDVANLTNSDVHKKRMKRNAHFKPGGEGEKDGKYVQAKVAALKTIIELQEKKIKLGRELGIITVDVLPDDPDKDLKSARDDVILSRLQDEVEKIVDIANQLDISPDEIDKFLMKDDKDE